MASLLPDTTELKEIKDAKDQLRKAREFFRLPNELWDAFSTELGTVASLRALALIPPEDVKEVMEALRSSPVGSFEREITPVEEVQLAGMWRAARVAFQLPDVDPLGMTSITTQPMSLGGSFSRGNLLSTGAIDKKAFVLGHKHAAKTAFEGSMEIFRDDNPLLLDLRRMFDSIANERGATRVSSRSFKRLLPELRRKFPQLAMSFARINPRLMSAEPWLMWEDFVSSCLGDEKLESDLKRSLTVVVYGVDRVGNRVYKDDLEPAHLCEKGVAGPPLLPWETAHVAEWRISDLRLSRHGAPAYHGGVQLRAGTSIASPPFRAGGACGYLRFWPAGYWNETQRRRKIGGAPGSDIFHSKGVSPEPSLDSWCCIGVFFPAGTHLNLRLFVGSAKSSKRACCFGNTTTANQVFAPLSQVSDLPDEVIDGASPVVVGVEILRNIADHHGSPPAPGVDEESLRCRLRPRIKAWSVVVAGADSTAPERSQSAPILEAAGPTKPSTQDFESDEVFVQPRNLSLTRSTTFTTSSGKLTTLGTSRQTAFSASRLACSGSPARTPARNRLRTESRHATMTPSRMSAARLAGISPHGEIACLQAAIRPGTAP